MNLVKIEAHIDPTKSEHVEALNKFLIAVGTCYASSEKKERPSVDELEEKPKQTRKKAEKVETLSPEDFVKESEGAFKNAIEEETKAEAEAEAIEVIEPETVSAPTLMQIRSLVAQKAGEHKDSIKAKLIELGAQNVSTLDAKHFQTIFAFLTEL